MWKIKQIAEADFGCEERPEGRPAACPPFFCKHPVSEAGILGKREGSSVRPEWAQMPRKALPPAQRYAILKTHPAEIFETR